MPRDDVPTIAISIGDPAGIGPEVTLAALADPDVLGLAEWLICGDRAALPGVARVESDRVRMIDLHALSADQIQIGRASAVCGTASVAYVRRAVELCLSGEAAGMVTAPLNKETVALSGLAFTGHTEYIAELCGVGGSRMLLVNDKLGVVHVTTHIPLRAACDVNPQRVLETIRLGAAAMKSIRGRPPRVAVCGLNPHAGEHGLFGNEDALQIAPAVAQAHAQGVDVVGPLPADTLFHQASRGRFDLVVAMYHDQGHIPMKVMDFENTVNVSLGLPIIRTSVDHGTAYDIAGKKIAAPDSMKAAMRLAVAMSRSR